MGTIRDVLKAAQEAEAMLKIAMPASSLAAALDAAEAVKSSGLGEALSSVRCQLSVLKMVQAEHDRFASLIHSPALEVARSLGSVLDSARLATLLESEVRMANDWSAALRAAESLQVPPIVQLEAHYAKLFEYSTLAESALRDVRIESLGARLGIEEGLRAELVQTHTDLSREYRSFYNEFTNPAQVVGVPRSLTVLPAVEFVHQATLVRSTSEVEAQEGEQVRDEWQVRQFLAQEAEDEVTKLVTDFDPELGELLAGARDAFQQKRADFVRHCTTSYRELFTQVIHRLAPDEKVKAWSTDPNDFHQGRPTRAARLRFITKSIGQRYGGFLTADIAAVVKFTESFQQGTHGVRPGFTDEQLVELKVRMEGLLLFLLSVPRVL